MALFQNSVLKKYLKGLESEKVDTAFNTFTAYFHNPTIQENIRNAKEEQYQEGFLRELFVKVLGYTLNPKPDFNLTTEFKNVRGGKKADGAILYDQKAIAVIELKGTNTTNLDKVESQAFGYKNNQPDAIYVITSNFEKIRFYIDNAVDYEEFNLFQLTRQRFSILWLCLAQESIFQNLAKRLKGDSLEEEENVTKKLYKDYSTFKKELFESIAKRNPDKDKLVLYKKTQKLLDRFLFIFFAEDRLLLPPNSIRKIIDQWVKLRDELDAYTPLYERFKKYFTYLLEGRPKNGQKDEIFAYNGGLFEPDEILDNIQIDDDILYTHTLNLTHYDYETEIDVNILGHIFEHSLTEIEEISAQLEGHVVDTKNNKRKKDGVFYTPKYITKYIVENTVGKLCEEKKTELGINHFDFSQNYLSKRARTTKRGKKTHISSEGEEMLYTLENYRNWLLNLTICDPACGSGAFLNQALEFLIYEHNQLDQLQAKLTGSTLLLSDVENSILENNLFGVDLNDESVEIARLSLWLRTAQKGRKLTSLNNNIKCGNSLIDDREIAGVKAFDWKEEFPTVFANGGFDTIIGNPPYVRYRNFIHYYPTHSAFLEKNYQSAKSNYDLYVPFIEKSRHILKASGIASLILPHKWLISEFGKDLRKFLSTNKAVESIVHFGHESVFSDATTYTCILNVTKTVNEYLKFAQISPLSISEGVSFENISFSFLSEENWNLSSGQTIGLLQKIGKQPFTVKDKFTRIFQGLATSSDKFFVMKGIEKGDYVECFSKSQDKAVTIEKKLLKPFIKPTDIKKYNPLNSKYYVVFPYLVENEVAVPMNLEYIKNSFPNGYQYYLENEKILRARERGRFDNENEWFLFSRKQGISGVEKMKIITPEIANDTNMMLDTGRFYHSVGCYSFVLSQGTEVDYKYYLGILNSPIMWFFLKNTGNVLRGGYFRFKTKYLEPFPLPLVPSEEIKIKISNRVDFALQHNEALSKYDEAFRRLISRKFEINDLSKSLQRWFTLTYTDFLNELKKKKIKLSLSEESEWEEYFEQEKVKTMALQEEIDKTEDEINQMVYRLYELTEEEITIVENT